MAAINTILDTIMATDLNSASARIAANSFTSNRVNNNTVAPEPTVDYRRTSSTADGQFDPKTTVKIEQDWRVRISLPTASELFYKSNWPGIMGTVKESGGVIFPYTPGITVTNEANYESAQTTHSNYENFFYKGSKIQAISITGDFTVQNEKEGRYVLGCTYFLRAATKMFFGGSSNAGNPPVMVFLNGYGSHYFPNVPCVITSFAHTLPADVDYMKIYQILDNGFVLAETPTWVPVTSQITVTLQPIYSRSKLYNSYFLEQIARGQLLDGFGFL